MGELRDRLRLALEALAERGVGLDEGDLFLLASMLELTPRERLESLSASSEASKGFGMPGRFDPVELLRVLLDHDVRFVVVGGVAGNLAGSPIATRDLDLDLGDFRIRAIDLETLIQSKVFAGRPKDHYALPFLRELLRIRESRDESSS